MRNVGAFEIALWLGGPILWATHFLVVYASESLLCTRATPHAHSALVAIATVVCLGLISVLMIRSRRIVALEFLRWSSTVLGGMAAVGVAWSAAVALLLPSCTPIG